MSRFEFNMNMREAIPLGLAPIYDPSPSQVRNVDPSIGVETVSFMSKNDKIMLVFTDNAYY
jgi:hypothetical protein